MPLAYYSNDRVRLLRIALFVTTAVAVLMVAGAVALLVMGYVEFGLAAAFPGSLLLAAALISLRSVRGVDRWAKVSCVMTGILCVLVGLAMSTAPIGLLPLLTGVAVLVLALTRDPGPRRTVER
jgi:hypothetical protein